VSPGFASNATGGSGAACAWGAATAESGWPDRQAVPGKVLAEVGRVGSDDGPDHWPSAKGFFDHSRGHLRANGGAQAAAWRIICGIARSSPRAAESALCHRAGGPLKKHPSWRVPPGYAGQSRDIAQRGRASPQRQIDAPTSWARRVNAGLAAAPGPAGQRAGFSLSSMPGTSH